ncbi:MAG: glycosyltransferase family A protein [Geminicoccaceae bacterium]
MRILVGICTCNRVPLLRSLLQHLREISLGGLAPRQVGILVVDNMPTGEVASLCRELAPTMPITLDCVEEDRRGISFARNRAAVEALARGADFLCFIDDDDRPEPDWLVDLVARQDMTGVDIVVGNRVYVDAAENFEQASADRPDPRTRNETEIWKKNGLPNLLTACNVLISRTLLETLAGKGPVFDPAFGLMGGEDADFFMRARGAGACIARAEHSLVKVRVWSERATVSGVMRRKFRSGCSEGHLVRRYMAAGQRVRWFGQTAWRFARSGGALMAGLFAASKRNKALSKLAWCCGAAFGYAGGSYNYYANARTMQTVQAPLVARTP